MRYVFRGNEALDTKTLPSPTPRMRVSPVPGFSASSASSSDSAVSAFPEHHRIQSLFSKAQPSDELLSPFPEHHEKHTNFSKPQNSSLRRENSEDIRINGLDTENVSASFPDSLRHNHKHTPRMRKS